MLNILTITLPIFLIIGVGFIAVRQGFFKKADTMVMGKFVMNIALPPLLFRAISQRSIDEVINGSYLLAYGFGSLLVFALAFILAFIFSGRKLEVSALRGMGSAMSNTAFVGFPVLLQFLGPVAGLAMAMTLMVENILMFPLVLFFAEAGISASKHQGGARIHMLVTTVLGRVVKNPLIIAIALGALFSAFGWSLPPFLDRGLELLANASAAVALFVIGGALVGLSLAGMKKHVGFVLVGKLVLHPLAVFFLLTLLPPMDRNLTIAAVVLASAPMLSIYPVIGQKYGEEGFCAASLLATTVASFITISAVLWVIQNSGMI